LSAALLLGTCCKQLCSVLLLLLLLFGSGLVQTLIGSYAP
jgi:hypothetical protein